MTTISDHIFRQITHSELSKQEHIGKLSEGIRQDIYADIPTDDAEASEIAGVMLGFTDNKVMAEILRRALRGRMQDALIMRQLILSELDASVRRTAKLRALRHVKSLEPEI